MFQMMVGIPFKKLIVRLNMTISQLANLKVFLCVIFIATNAFFGTLILGLVSSIILVVVTVPVISLRKPQHAGNEALNYLRGASEIAHRGAGNDAPENTISAFSEAKKNGAQMVEVDLKFTSDGECIIIHDDTLERTTNGHGSVAGKTLQEIKSLNASAKDPLGSSFPNEKIPTLEETVKFCIENKLMILFDVKTNPELAVHALYGIYEKYPDLYNTSIVASFNPYLIYKLRSLNIDITTGLIWRPRFISWEDYDGPWRPVAMWKKPFYYIADLLLEWSHLHILWFLIGNNVFLVHKNCISRRFQEHFLTRGVELAAWTVNDGIEKSFLKTVLKISVITDSLKKSK